MQLVAGRTAQEYNRRRQRRGAFWEDRYHATIVDSAQYLVRCIVYIDLNMVRAGVVRHPCEWPEAGYHEIQRSRGRYRIIDRGMLCELLETTATELASSHEQWVDESILAGVGPCESFWSTAVAVGGRAFTMDIRGRLARRPRYHPAEEASGLYVLREREASYTPDSCRQMVCLSEFNSVDWR